MESIKTHVHSVLMITVCVCVYLVAGSRVQPPEGASEGAVQSSEGAV